MRVALVTCERPIERDEDADFLTPALRREGVEVEAPGWSAAGVDWGSFDVAKLSSTWDYHERPDEFRAWLRKADRATRLINPLEVVEWNLDKRYLSALAALGVPTIPTVWSSPGAEEEAVAEVARRGWRDVIVKPVLDLDASNLIRIDATRIADMLPRYGTETMVQPFVSSVATEGELSLVYIAGELSHALRRRPSRGDFRVQELYGGTHEPEEAPAEAIAIAERALAAAPGPPTYARVDLLMTEGGDLALIELELTEPSLYLDVEAQAAPRLARALLAAG